MELGSTTVRNQNVNLLHEAVHTDHGLVYTDGRAIYLAPLSLYNGQVESQQSVKLGEFEPTSSSDKNSRGVKSAHWSDSIEPGLCFLCVVHDKNISIWKVEGALPKLTFKQVRKLNVQPIFQGCLWNPGRDILCVACPQQCSFYYSHSSKKGSHVLPQVESLRIRCGTWLPGGQQLVVCAGTSLVDVGLNLFVMTSRPLVLTYYYIKPNSFSSTSRIKTRYAVLLQSNLPFDLATTWGAVLSSDNSCLYFCSKLSEIYTWADIDKSVSSFTCTAWIVPGIDGGISSVVGVSEDRIVCATDLPLDSLCKNQDVFSLPDLVNVKSSAPYIDQGGGDIIRPRREASSLKDSLLNIPRNSQSVVKDTSQLLCIQLLGEKDPQKLCSADVQGVLSPDLLHLEPCSKLLVVGSNNQTLLQVFSLSETSMVKTSEIAERPKGVSTLPKSRTLGAVGFLVLVGKMANLDTAFLPPSTTSEMELVLKFYAVQKDNIEPKQQRIPLSEMPPNMARQKSTTENDKPPQKPARKKRASSKNREQAGLTLQQDSRSSLLMKESLSTDVSPRVSGTDIAIQNTDVQPADILQKTADRLSNVSKVSNGSQVEDTRNILLRYSKDSTPEASDDSAKSSPRHISLRVTQEQNFVSTGSKIVEIGSENEVTSELETEKVDFSSRTSNFSCSSFSSDLQDESEKDKLVQDYIQKKLDVNSADGEVDKEEATPDVKEADSSITLVDEVSSIEELEQQLEEQNLSISRLQSRMAHLSKLVEQSSCVLPTRYQTPETPELINILCHYEDGQMTHKTFLLDNGRLQLEPVKKAFGVETVELMIGADSLVTGCNIDGYIPMRFSPGSHLHITGRK